MAINKSQFTLIGAPPGTTIASVTRVSDTEVTVTLAYAGGHLQFESDMSVHISADAVDGDTAYSTNAVTVLPVITPDPVYPPSGTVQRRAIFATLGAVNVWSGHADVVWESKTYKPGILLADEIVAGQSLQSSAAPGLSIFIQDVANLPTDVQSGDEFEIHVCSETATGWEKIGGFWGLIDEVSGPINEITISTLPPLERFTKVERPRWSREDYRSRYSDDGFFDNLEDLRNDGRVMNIWER